MVKIKVYAKLNLSLDVGKKTGGFHEIESAVMSVDVFDEVTVNFRTDTKVTVSGTFVPLTDDTAYKAAKYCSHSFGTVGADIYVVKGITEGAGLGGSSADAAAVIAAYALYNGIPVYSLETCKIASKTGSDVSYMLKGGAAILRGKGDNVTFFEVTSPLYFCLCEFDARISSAKAYERFDVSGVPVHTNNAALIRAAANGDANTVKKTMSNGLEKSVSAMNDYAEKFKKFAWEHNIAVNMTGSGSAYYSVYANLCDAEKDAAILRKAGYSSRCVKSVSRGLEILP